MVAHLLSQTHGYQARESVRLKDVDRFRVCHLSMTLKTGGLERLLVDYGQFHNSNRFDLSFVALDGIGTPGDQLQAAGFDVQHVRLAEIGKVNGFRKLVHILKTGEFDILHTHNTYPHFYGALAAKWARIPVVVNSQHGRGCGPNRKALWQFRIANEMTNATVGVSADATQLCQQQNRWRSHNMRCIWNGIDVERFRFRGPHDTCTAISVGRLSPEKDYATLLRATKIVQSSFPDFKLKIIGDGAERPALELLARSLGITQIVTFLGERSDVHEQLATAGFFVSSSTTEGISLTLLEAMAVGLPIVTTAVGGSPEIVVPEKTGTLVPPQDPDCLAAAMIEMLERRALWPKLGRSGRERVVEKFNIRTMISEYESLYSELYANWLAENSGAWSLALLE